MRILKDTNSFNAVGAGQKATLDLPRGPITYHGLRIYYGTSTAGGPNQANMEAHITRVRILLNGIVQREFTAAELFAINALKGRTFQTGLLPIFFSEPWRRTALGEDGLAWGTANVDTFQVEVEIDAAAGAPTLEAIALFEEVPRPLGPIVKWNRYVVPVSAIGITNWLPPKEDALFAIHNFSSDITDAEVTVDQREVFKATQTQADDHLQDYGFAPQAGLFPIVFDSTRRAHESLPMYVGQGSSRRQIAQLQVDYNMSAATNFDVVTETVGPRN